MESGLTYVASGSVGLSTVADTLSSAAAVGGIDPALWEPQELGEDWTSNSCIGSNQPAVATYVVPHYHIMPATQLPSISFCTLWPCDLWWLFDLILNARTHDGLSCGKFGDCSFSRFGSIVWTDTQTHTHTDRQEEYFTPATLVSMSYWDS